jgi:hypothetical protein
VLLLLLLLFLARLFQLPSFVCSYPASPHPPRFIVADLYSGQSAALDEDDDDDFVPPPVAGNDFFSSADV